jgi:hypothetical protein
MPIALVSEQSNVPEPIAAPRHTRRLSDRIAVAFHQACDLQYVEAAQALLYALEFVSERSQAGTDRLGRSEGHNLVAAHERLWHLRHPQR